MSVQERWTIEIEGVDQGLVVAARLAAAAGASIRWAALWTSRSIAAELRSHFGTTLREASDEAGGAMFCLARPSLEAVRELISRAGADRFAVRWTPRIYTTDDGGEGAWIAYRDARGFLSQDAKIYGIELAMNAVPLTVMGDRPDDDDLRFGPESGSGSSLGIVIIRDHMPSEELLRWVEIASAIPPARIRKASS
jgi:hypothetical protein